MYAIRLIHSADFLKSLTQLRKLLPTKRILQVYHAVLAATVLFKRNGVETGLHIDELQVAHIYRSVPIMTLTCKGPEPINAHV